VDGLVGNPLLIVPVTIVAIIVGVGLARLVLARMVNRAWDRMSNTVLAEALEQQDSTLAAEAEADLESIQTRLRATFQSDPAALDAHLGLLRIVVETNHEVGRVFGRLFAHQLASDEAIAMLQEQVRRLALHLPAQREHLRPALVGQIEEFSRLADRFAPLAVDAQGQVRRDGEVGDDTFMELVQVKDRIDRTYHRIRDTARSRRP
jgi:hypothetical protein